MVGRAVGDVSTETQEECYISRFVLIFVGKASISTSEWISVKPLIKIVLKIFIQIFQRYGGCFKE